MRKHPSNRLNFIPCESPRVNRRYNVYQPSIGKDDEVRFLHIGVAKRETLEDWNDWYDKHQAVYFEFQLRVRELRIEIRKFFSNLFKKDKTK